LFVHGAIVLLSAHLPVVNLVCLSDQVVNLLLCVDSQDFLSVAFIIAILSVLAIVSVLSVLPVLAIIPMLFVFSLLVFEIFVFEVFSGLFLIDWGLLPFLLGRGDLFLFLCPARAFISVCFIIFVIFFIPWSLRIILGDLFSIFIGG
jgi:hypothetical protein